ncbi:SusC/RagA family TonB-linked outer membrane protein [Aestuariivivens sediminis]|uniref:SusC/RagA family TonB-linked outer membrane protein n=1 Tax=Aestuariivivens sediminis TaxID=2913557 RepID=UPI001F5A9E92|nr:TonB-dependent receptor [Aestuariivivens sediminis]
MKIVCIFKEKGLYLLFFLFFLSFKVSAQDTVSGTVKSKGLPLPGATITIKGTNTGTVSDFNGKYEIKAKSDAVLLISFLGYETLEENVNGRSEININLEESQEELSEVVLVGYGAVKKSDFTGSSSKVANKELEEFPITNLESALQGRMAGVNITSTSSEPGGGVSIQIRGATSLSGGNQPLYVIDGVPQFNDASRSAAEINGFAPTNALASLNPNDIESVEVLKDASSAAIYGSRGANGVIIITTKKGKAGESNITFDTFTTIAERPKSIPLATAREFATHINLANTNLGGEPYYNGEERFTVDGQQSVIFPNPEELGQGTDWQREIFRSAITNNYQLTASGGNDAVRYLLSGNYLKDEGVVKFSKYRKGAFRLNLDADLNKRLKAVVNLSYSADLNDRAESTNLSTTPGGLSPSGSILKSLITSPALSTDNQLYQVFLLLPDRGSSSGLLNPLLDLENTINQRRYNIFQGSMDLTYKFNDNLNFTVRTAYNRTFSANDSYWNNLTAFGYDAKQRTFQSDWRTNSYINENFLTYNKNTEDFNINVVVGNTLQKEDGRGAVLNAENLSIPTNNGLFLIPLYQNISIPQRNFVESTLVSGFARGSFSYKGKYLLTLTGRADASSKFAENKKWAFFPSVGLGWTFSSETFFEEFRNVISTGKFRFSYGTSGNQAISPFQSLSTLAPLNFGFRNGQATGIVTNSSENKDLSWETTTQIDYGLDLSFLNNRFNLTLDLYEKETEDLLQAKDIPSESGFNSILSNFGTIKNKGFEISLSGKILNKENFGWDFAFNYARNENEIVDLGEGVEFYNAQNGQADYTHRLRVGGQLGDFWGFETDGLLSAEDITNGAPTLGGSTFEGDLKFKDTNEDGAITDADKVLLGNAFPDFTIGISNNFSFKNWELNSLIVGNFGNEILNQNLLYGTYGSYFGVPTQKYLSDFWTPENKDAYYPRPSAGAVNNVTSDRLIEDGSFLRIKTLSLVYNYQLPNSKTKFRFNLTAQNLFTFTDYSGYDPEVSGYGQSILTPGIDVGSYPRTRLWTIGAQVQF